MKVDQVLSVLVLLVMVLHNASLGAMPALTFLSNVVKLCVDRNVTGASGGILPEERR